MGCGASKDVVVPAEKPLGVQPRQPEQPEPQQQLGVAQAIGLVAGLMVQAATVHRLFAGYENVGGALWVTYGEALDADMFSRALKAELGQLAAGAVGARSAGRLLRMAQSMREVLDDFVLWGHDAEDDKADADLVDALRVPLSAQRVHQATADVQASGRVPFARFHDFALAYERYHAALPRLLGSDGRGRWPRLAAVGDDEEGKHVLRLVRDCAPRLQAAAAEGGDALLDLLEAELAKTETPTPTPT